MLIRFDCAQILCYLRRRMNITVWQSVINIRRHRSSVTRTSSNKSWSVINWSRIVYWSSIMSKSGMWRFWSSSWRSWSLITRGIRLDRSNVWLNRSSVIFNWNKLKKYPSPSVIRWYSFINVSITSGILSSRSTQLQKCQQFQ